MYQKVSEGFYVAEEEMNSRFTAANTQDTTEWRKSTSLRKSTTKQNDGKVCFIVRLISWYLSATYQLKTHSLAFEEPSAWFFCPFGFVFPRDRKKVSPCFELTSGRQFDRLWCFNEFTSTPGDLGWQLVVCLVSGEFASKFHDLVFLPVSK